MKVVIEHGWYGCDTGCCGTVFELWDDDGKMIDRTFQFDHYDTEAEAIAEAKTLYDAIEFEVNDFKCWDF